MAILVMRRVHGSGFCGAVCLLLLCCLPCPANAQDSLVLAVHPYLPFDELMERYTPLADYLGNQLERTVEVRIGSNYADHMGYIGRDEVDIAFMGPALYVDLVDKYGEKPLLARLEIDGKPLFHGKIITRKGSPLTRLADLRGRSFAFGDPESTMSHLVPRFMLLQAGITTDDLAEYRYLGSHTNVALGVLTGDFDAGAVKEEVFYQFEQQGLQALATTPAFSEHVFVARSTLPPQTVAALQEALYHLKDTPEGRAILAGIKEGLSGLVPARDSDYDNLRAVLNILHRHGIH